MEAFKTGNVNTMLLADWMENDTLKNVRTDMVQTSL